MTQKQLSKQLGFSDITNKRQRDYIRMDTPYIRNKYRKKNNKRKSSITQTHTTITTESTKENDLKSGSLLENDHQVENNKFISIARKLVDKVYVFHSSNGYKNYKQNEMKLR